MIVWDCCLIIAYSDEFKSRFDVFRGAGKWFDIFHENFFSCPNLFFLSFQFSAISF